MWKIFYVCFCLLLCADVARAQSVKINEMMASNEGVILDEDGDFSDWIELYNPADESADLAGYGLSDDPDEPYKWVFPEFELGASEFLLVFCSGKDRLEGPYLHTNFSIKSSGEALYLTDPEGNLIDELEALALATNYSYGFLLDGQAYRERFDISTPGESNQNSPSVIFSHQAGFYPEPIALTLQATQGSSIHYTTDGSEPSFEDPQVEGSLVLFALSPGDEGISYIQTSINWQEPDVPVHRIHTLRAAAFDGEERLSPVYTKSYFIAEEAGTHPVVSIVTEAANLFDEEGGIFVPGDTFDPNNPEWTGNFFQRGSDWERDIHFEVFEEGLLRTAQDAGMRIHGGKTRNAPQKSLRLYGRDYHGAHKFHYPFFETKDKRVFDKLILRAHFGCWNKTMIKDGLSARIAQDLDFDTQHHRLCTVFINGEYWGMYAFRDYFDSDYFEEVYEVEKEDVSILIHGSGIRPGFDETWGIVEGSNGHYLALMDFIENNQLADESNYAYVASQLDVSSMIDFYCTAIYFNHYDWPSNNHKVWRGEEESSWRWMMYDFDSAWGYRPSNFDTFLYASHPTGTSIYNTPYATWLFRKLLESPHFIEAFAQRYACLLRNEFAQERVEGLLDEFVANYEVGLPEHFERWNLFSSQSAWNSAVNARLRNFNEERLEYAIEHASLALGFAFNPDDYVCEEDPDVTDFPDEGLQAGLLVYPNPAGSFAWIDAPEVAENAVIKVYELSGRLHFQDTYRFHYRLNTADWPRGLYLLVIESGSKRQSARLFIGPQ